MSIEESHTTKTSQKSEHGTLMSYVTGFVLSLIFTLIPYYLVTEKVITGNALLIAILGIAVLQMAIQLLFFLHLGRGPKPFYNVVFFFATAGVIVVTIGASLFIMNNLYHNMSPEEVTLRLAQEEGISQVGGEETGACQGVKESHTVTITDGKASPITTQAKRCDTLTFINEDDQTREMTFSSARGRESYGGLFEVPVDKGHSETLTLNQIGDFTFYDSFDSGLTGSFSVEP